MDEKHLEQYKKIYLEEKISGDDLQKNWEVVSRILPAQELPPRNNIFSNYGFLFACIVLIMLIGTVSMAQASRSGELLYPVKVLTNNVAAKLFGKPQITAEKVKIDTINESTKAPKPTEKESGQEQKNLEQKEKEIKEQNEPRITESKENERKEEKQVKGASSDRKERGNLPDSEVTQVITQKNEERGESNKNKPNESSNEGANKERSKNENYRNAN